MLKPLQLKSSKPLLFKKSGLYLPVLLLLFLFSSCASTKKIKYFQDIPDSGQLEIIAKAQYEAPRIQIDDILTILVETVDLQATAMINIGNVSVQNTMSPAGQATGLGSPVSFGGYLVNKDGFVEVPVLGHIKLLGLTTIEAKEVILKEANKYFKDPTVIVRYANFKVSVTGEVLKPGQYVMANEKVTILDALAIAGDLTIFGKRENVLLIRENEDGTKSPYRVNLKKSNIMSAPYYYLRQNDIIYVEPRKAKSDATDAAQFKYITIAGTILSILLVFATRRY